MESTLFYFKNLYEFLFFDYLFLMKGNFVFVQGRGLFLISFMIFDKPTVDLLVSWFVLQISKISINRLFS
jgi:hypothetical protein